MSIEYHSEINHPEDIRHRSITQDSFPLCEDSRLAGTSQAPQNDDGDTH